MLQRSFWGLILIAAGVLFILDRTGIITVDFHNLIGTYWPVFIIVAGASGLLSSLRYGWGAAIWNLIVCGVGVIFLLHNLHVTDLSLGELFTYLAPAALILFGLALMFRRPAASRKERQPFRHPDQSYYDIYGKTPPGPDEGISEPRVDKNKDEAKAADPIAEKMERHAGHMARHAERAAWKAQRETEKWERKRRRREWHEQLRRDWYEQHRHEFEAKHDYISTFDPASGNVQHKSGFIGDVVLGRDYWDLQPLAISHFIGDTLIDLTKATIPYGETKIVVSTFIGDVKMLVPADLDVEVAVTASSFVGDMHVLDRHESGMFRNLQTETPYYRESERKIKLVVSAFIGDVFVQKVG
jgi:lia operon protein LiaF